MIPSDSQPSSLIAGLQRRFPLPDRVLTLDEWATVRDSEAPLTLAEMRSIVDIAAEVLQGLYVHLDLKLARRGVDPVRQMSVFRERLDDNMAPRAFHDGMLRIFKSLGDAHTAYRLPSPHKCAVAFLPFLVSAYEREDKTQGFVVSHMLDEAEKEFAVIQFGRGAEIVSWNGMKISDAVRAATEFEEGSNLSNDLLLTLQFMSVRWLGASFGPESPWVVIGYKNSAGVYYESKFYWLILHFASERTQIIVAPQAVDAIFQPFRSVQSRERAIHVASAHVHLSRKALFVGQPAEAEPTPESLEQLGRAFVPQFFGYIDREAMRRFTDAQPELRREPGSDEFRSLLPMFLVARQHTLEELIENARVEPPAAVKSLPPGLSFGYIGIRAFPPMGFARELFTYELRRLLNLMPGGGLILDIRDNPGGSANLAEESLQFITPHPITPLPFRFLATRTTQHIARAAFDEYAASIQTAMSTGGRFSAGRPITSVRHANELGQHYFGPVVLLTNAATYSAADIFAAGFVDHQIGEAIGVNDTTGGGGANCWFYSDDVTIVLDGARTLPRDVNMQIAVRQCSRVGKDNDGVLIEETGVQTLLKYPLTREDILDRRPWRLLLAAVSRLSKPRYDLSTSLEERNGDRFVRVKTENIERLDFFVNGRPSSHSVRESGVVVDSPTLPRDDRIELEIRGYVKPNELVARYIQVFPFRE
jgi:hypothetical protein